MEIIEDVVDRLGDEEAGKSRMSTIDDKRVEIACCALGEIKLIPYERGALNAGRDVYAIMDRHGLVKANPTPDGILGWTIEGLRYASMIATSLRAGPPDRSQTVSNDTLSEQVRNALVDLWVQADGRPSEVDVRGLLHEVTQWIDCHDVRRTFLIPCKVMPYQNPPFAIGPVKFCPITDCDAPGEDEIIYRHLLEMSGKRSADWMAEIELIGREEGQACLVSDLAVDIAIGGLQLICGDKSFYKSGRASARLPSAETIHFWTDDAGSNRGVLGSDDVGSGTLGYRLDQHLRANSNIVACIGERLEGYLSGVSPVKSLDAIWCNAVYWYHEALAENIETIAISKIVVCLEVLSANGSGTSSKLKLIISKILKISGDYNLRISNMTLDNLIELTVEVRSRVLHGNWLALQPDVPPVKIGIPRFHQVESLAREVLLRAARLMSDYALVDKVIDDMGAFMSWLDDKA